MTATATHNGTETTAKADAHFPVDSFRDAAPHLRRPFTPEAVKFKVQSTYKNNTGALIVAYIDARLAIERLNLIVPHLWWDDYEREDKGYRCHLTIDGITRKDIGDGFGKAGHSDALKRAAVKFGIGVSLYAIPQTHLAVDRQEVRPVRTSKGESLAMTAKGEQLARTRYREWLTATGIEAFGEPLSHGDVENSQGDVEGDDEPPIEPTTDPGVSTPSEPTFVLAQDIVNELVAAKKATGKDDEWVRQQLVAVGLSSVPSGKVTLATIRNLTERQAMNLLERFENAIEASNATA